jgi:hypothetical protein
MLELKDDNWKLLPKKIQKRVNDFLEHLKEITWFRPKKDLKKSEVDKQAKLVLECFWIEAKIEYRKLETKKDWDLARDLVYEAAYNSAKASSSDSIHNSDWDLVRYSAYNLAWDLANDSANNSIKNSAYDSAWILTRTSAYTAVELLVIDNEGFKKQYPNGAFTQLFKLWEMGLYPIWVLKENKKFVIYVDPKYCLKKNWWFK